MPIYTVQSPDGKTYDIEGPEGATVEQLSSVIGGQKPQPYDVPAGLKSAMNIGQAISFGFGDEIAGRFGADRGRYNATVEQFRNEYPGSSALGSVSGSLLIPGSIAKLAKYNPFAVAGATGGVMGALQGAGDSEPEKRQEGAVRGGAIGMAAGPMFMGATKAVAPIAGALASQVVSNIPKVGERYSEWLARNRVADAFRRDNVSVSDVQNKLAELGTEARLADAAGENTRGLLDLNANLPGKTKDQLETLIRNRIAARPDRMDDMVYAVNGGFGRAGELSAALQRQKEEVAGPLYEQLHKAQVKPTENLVNILKAADKLGAFSEGSTVATAKMQPFTLKGADVERMVKTSTDPLTNSVSTQLVGGKPLAMRDLDMVKRGLDSLIERETDAITGKVSTKGAAFTDLKKKLVSELDSIVPDYKAARDAFAGPASLQNAIKKGRAFWNDDAEGIKALTSDMTQGELEAFRVGASERLREMAGSQSGQNKLLNIWKDRNTREKIRALVGDEAKFADVQKMLGNEETLKRLESLGPGRNSRTFSREAGSEQQTLDNAADLVSAGLSAKTGGLASMIGGLGKYSARVGTPEPVRDSIGSILMSKYQPMEMKALQAAQEAIDARRKAAAATSGAVGGKFGGGLLDLF